MGENGGDVYCGFKLTLKPTAALRETYGNRRCIGDKPSLATEARFLA